MIWFILLFWATMIPITFFGVLTYRIDPIDHDLWRRSERDTLIVCSVCWPFLWIAFSLVGATHLLDDGFSWVARSSLGQLVNRIDEKNDKHQP